MFLFFISLINDDLYIPLPAVTSHAVVRSPAITSLIYRSYTLLKLVGNGPPFGSLKPTLQSEIYTEK